MADYRLPYYDKDYDSIKSELLQKIQVELPNSWTDFTESDIGMTLLELFSGISDMLSYNMDNQIKETYLTTALRRTNVAKLASILGYDMKPKQAGTTKVSVCIPIVQSIASTIPQYTTFKTGGVTPTQYSSVSAYSIPANQSCVFEVENQPVTGGKLSESLPTDTALSGVDIVYNTGNAKLYVLAQYDSTNKIALFTRKPTNGTLDNIITTNYQSLSNTTPITGVTLSDPTGVNGAGALVYSYNGGTGRTLQYKGGLPIVIDAGGTFVLEGLTVSNSVEATVDVVSLPLIGITIMDITITTVNTSDNAYKVAYGSTSATTAVMAACNSSNITGVIRLTENLDTVLNNNIELKIDGPVCFEGVIAQDTFAATGLLDQVYNTTVDIQQIPTMLNKTIAVSVGLSNWEEATDTYLKRENIFKTNTIEADYSTIIFGDGESGNIPTEGTQVVVTYVSGTGANGTVGKNMLTTVDSLTFVGTQVFTLQSSNIEGSIGAVDQESIDATKDAALSYFKSRGRSVNEEDYVARVLDYTELAMINTSKVQVYKDTTTPDLINHLFIYVLGADTDTGRATTVDLDITSDGGLYKYVTEYKVIPEGIVTDTGVDGLNHGSILDAVLYYNISIVDSYDTVAVKYSVSEAIKAYYHGLEIQQEINISELYSTIMAIEGVRTCGIYTDPTTQDSTTAAYDLTLSGVSNLGKLYVLPEDYYTNYKNYVKLTTDSIYG